MMTTVFTKKRLFKIALVALAIALLNVVAPKAQALSGSEFNPGRIIDDSVFYNKDAMSVAEIQNFIYSKSGPCDTNRPTTNSNYQPPWTCLYQYRENTTTKVNNIGAPTTNPSGSITAAQIIYDAAQAYSISPKALLVLIQKESSLVTDNWPWSNQYRSATGYGCPDGAACDSQYYGFYNQVSRAAFQLRRYATYPNEYNVRAGRNNNISYHPSGNCGAQTVYVQNAATAGLYNYTPYVPNSAALNNLYGTGDGCSSYGNRNFWRLYNDWFGSTNAAPYQWSFVSQSADKDLSNLKPGDIVNVTIVARNSGANTWSNSGSNQVNVVTDRPLGRTSSFADPSWISPNTPGRTTESSVAPGQNGTFSFRLKVPSQIGTYNEYFSLVAQNAAFFNTDIGQYFQLTIKPSYLWSAGGQTAYTDSSKLVPVDLSNMSPGQTAWLTVRARNTGNVAWSNTGTNKVSLVTDRAFARSSRFAADGWLSSNTPSDLEESTVAVGDYGTFEFPIKVPVGAGTFNEYFNPIVQNVGQLNNSVGQHFAITVKQNYKWSFAGQTAHTNSNKTTTTSLNGMAPGQTAWLTVRATNTGTSTWYKTGANQVNLITDRQTGRASRFATNAWLSSNTPARLNEDTVAPGATGTFEFPITVPAGPGSFTEYFNPVAQGVAFFNNDIGQHFQINVNQSYKWSFSSQSVYTDSGKATLMSLTNLTAGQTGWLVIRATNAGNATWSNTGTNRISLVTDRPFARSSRFATNTWLGSNTPVNLSESTVAPGATGTFEFPFAVPAGAGTYKEYFNPLVQNYAQMNNDIGQYFQFTVQ